MTPLALPQARAHSVGLSGAELEDGTLSLTFAQAELSATVPVDDLARARLALDDATFARVGIDLGGAPCTLGPGTWTRLEADGLRGVATLTCPDVPPTATMTYRAGFLSALPPGHRHVLRVPGGGERVLTTQAPAAHLDTPAVPGTGAVLRDFGRLGVEHIAGGADHLVFVFGLLLATARLRDALAVVSGFTLAHSVTLSAAALGWVTTHASWVEPAIAASVAFVGLENLGQPPVRRRMAVTFAIGLVHGFGFAGALRQIGLPPGRAVPALAAFNVGVELGQAVLVTLAMPVLHRARRHPRWDSRGLPALSLAVALLGSVWFVERLAGTR